MPNHVHALFKVDAVPMVEILESWKNHTVQKKRTGCWDGAVSFGTRIIGMRLCATASMNWRRANTPRVIRQRRVWFSIRKPGLGAARGFGMSLTYCVYEVLRLVFDTAALLRFAAL